MKLSELKTPAELKGLPVSELEDLAEQIRQGILFRTSRIGGHVGPNLGIVENAIAVHTVFDLPRDKLVLDVSHQDFPHKMLTGRAYGFTDPSRFHEIGEYSQPDESVYDIFWAGHTSPAISLSLGLAKARDLKQENYNVIALVGDGALSGGEALEGLNEAAVLGSNFIVIVNDNGMSIAEDHGGFYANLQLLRQTNGTAECNFFKAMGWDYRYEAEGNNIAKLIKLYEQIKDIDHPIVVHINTQKGEGYKYAEEFREKFHSSDPYKISTGELMNEPSGLSYATLTRDFITQKAKEDPTVIAVNAATPDVIGLGPEHRKALGKQYLDVGIAEQTATAAASGLAKGGAKPIFFVEGTFLQRAYDQLVEDVAMNFSPIVMPVFNASVWGIKDETHLGFWDIIFVSHIPNFVYLAPTNAEEYQAMLEWAITQRNNPVAIRVPANELVHAAGEVQTDYSVCRYQVVQKGSEVAIIALGDFFGLGQKTLEALKQAGIEATLINPRFITSLDTETLDALGADHKLVVTLEDGALEGGWGEQIARYYGDKDMKVLCRGLKKEFVNRYDPDELLAKNRLTADAICEDILKALEK